MEKGCFCHFNGYEVKDAAARRDLAQTNENVAAIENALDVERSRINQFTTLPDGSTTGDAELIDARVDHTGKTWENVGEHIRGVSSQLSGDKADKASLNVLLNGENLFNVATITLGSALKIDGSIVESAAYYISDFIKIDARKRYYIAINLNSASVAHCFYNSEKEYLSGIYCSGDYPDGLGTLKVEPPENATYIRITGFLSEVNKQSVQTINIRSDYTEITDIVRREMADISGQNLFDDITIKRGYYIHKDGRVIQGSVTFYASEMIPVLAGNHYLIERTLGSNWQYIGFYDESEMFVSAVLCRDSSGGMGSLCVEVPYSACFMRITGSIEDYDKQRIYKVDANNTLKNCTRSNHYPQVIKDANTPIDGFGYVAFSSGVIFDGKEVHVTRIGKQHVTPENSAEWGKVIFHIYDAMGNLSEVYPDIDFSALDGEPRDPNLTVSNDGRTLLLSFALKKSDGSYGGKLYALDRFYKVQSSCDVPTADYYFIWGNTLQTPRGYLLKTEYSTAGHYLLLIKSSEPLKHPEDLTNITFSGGSCELDVHGSYQPTECTIGYWKNKYLVAIWRYGTGTMSAKMAYTTDLEGLTGWSEPVEIGYGIHSPVLMQHCDDDYLIFGGGYRRENSRFPCIGLMNIISGEVKALVEYAKCSGGYQSFVRPSPDTISTVYYHEAANGDVTTLYHRNITLSRIAEFNAVLDPDTPES